jgi:hypothetical protein
MNLNIITLAVLAALCVCSCKSDNGVSMTVLQARARRSPANPEEPYVMLICTASLTNRTGRDIYMTTLYDSVFDGTYVTVKKPNGEVLHRKPYMAWRSPIVRQRAKLTRDKTEETILDIGPFDRSVSKIQIQLDGRLWESEYTRGLTSNVVEVNIEEVARFQDNK